MTPIDALPAGTVISGGPAGLRIIGRLGLFDLDGPLQVAGDATVAWPARHEPMDEASDAAAEHLAERPRLLCRRISASQCSFAVSLSAAQTPISAAAAAASMAGEMRIT